MVHGRFSAAAPWWQDVARFRIPVLGIAARRWGIWVAVLFQMVGLQRADGRPPGRDGGAELSPPGRNGWSRTRPLRTEMATLRTEMVEQFAALRAELVAEMASLRKDLGERLTRLEARMKVLLESRAPGSAAEPGEAPSDRPRRTVESAVAASAVAAQGGSGRGFPPAAPARSDGGSGVIRVAYLAQKGEKKSVRFPSGEVGRFFPRPPPHHLDGKEFIPCPHPRRTQRRIRPAAPLPAPLPAPYTGAMANGRPVAAAPWWQDVVRFWVPVLGIGGAVLVQMVGQQRQMGELRSELTAQDGDPANRDGGAERGPAVRDGYAANRDGGAERSPPGRVDGGDVRPCGRS